MVSYMEKNYQYQVKCEGKTFTAQWGYAGYEECLDFIEKNGNPNKNYKIRTIKKEVNYERI